MDRRVRVADSGLVQSYMFEPRTSLFDGGLTVSSVPREAAAPGALPSSDVSSAREFNCFSAAALMATSLRWRAPITLVCSDTIVLSVGIGTMLEDAYGLIYVRMLFAATRRQQTRCPRV